MCVCVRVASSVRSIYFVNLLLFANLSSLSIDNLGRWVVVDVLAIQLNVLDPFVARVVFRCEVESGFITSNSVCDLYEITIFATRFMVILVRFRT